MLSKKIQVEEVQNVMVVTVSSSDHYLGYKMLCESCYFLCKNYLYYISYAIARHNLALFDIVVAFPTHVYKFLNNQSK